MSEIEIEIDGRKLTAQPNATVIQVADEAGIYIPRFCYHKHLTIPANCRMCLVEVEKSGKPLPACATPVMPGMKVFTRSQKALAAQKAVMEFLLINHPLDCPICDQGGECELQDLSLGFGSAKSFYNEGKRSFKDKDIGPLIETEMTRCIQCTRCVRFGSEIAGMRELGATFRGEDMEIGTYIEHAMKSEISGNVIDICPVGALTSKPFRFTARAWELQQYPTVSPHDCVGSNLYAHVRSGNVMRVVPRENVEINQTWISDRDRYSYAGLNHDRAAKPLIKRDGNWEETNWQTAIEFAATGLMNVIEQHSPNQIGALATPTATLEEFYLLQKIVRGLGSPNIDYRLRQVDFTDQDCATAYPSLGMSFDDLEQSSTILLIGSNIQKDQPLASLRVRKAILKGAKAFAVNFYDHPFSFDLTNKLVVAPDEMVFALAGIAKVLSPLADFPISQDIQKLLDRADITPAQEVIATSLKESLKITIVVGNLAMNHPQAGMIRMLANLIAKLCHGQFGLLTEGGNAAGAWLAGATPYRGAALSSLGQKGLDVQAMLENPRKAYVLLNVEPDLDCANPALAVNALQKAEFVVSLSSFRSPIIDEHADVILPIGTFTETGGTFVNAAGTWQSFRGVAASYEESRPAWKVLRVLGNVLHLGGFDYESVDQVHHEIESMTANMPELPVLDIFLSADALRVNEDKLFRVGSVPLYATDAIVRRSKPLASAQPVLEGVIACVRVHPETGRKFKFEEGDLVTVKQGEGRVKLPVMFDDRLPLRGVMIMSGIPETVELPELFGEVEFSK